MSRVLFLAVLCLAGPLEAASPQAWAGPWEGFLDVGRVVFRVAVALQTDASGAVTAGTFTNIDDGIYDAPLQRLSRDGQGWSASLAGGEKLVLRPEAGAVLGTYTQADGSFQSPGAVSCFRLRRGGDWLVPRLTDSGAPATQYRYQRPRDLGDGWVPGSWTDAGLDAGILRDGIQKILDGADPHVHSLQVAYGGRLVLDEYFYGYGPADLHPLQSQTKSVFSILTGIAVGQGRLKPSDRLYDFFPECRKLPDWDPAKDKITLADVLTMRSGLGCNDWKDPQACSWAMVGSQDWLHFALALPLAGEPGAGFVYCGACLTPLSALLARQSGMPLADFARKFLWEPLGIGRVRWFRGPHQVVPVSFGLEMRPRDLLKLGQLYLDGGAWRGRRVVPEEWVRRSTKPWVPRSQTNGKNGYGYLWWEREMPAPGGAQRVFFAWGVGGQYLFVVPGRGLVCVVTGGNYKDGPLGARGLALFQDHVLGALPAR